MAEQLMSGSGGPSSRADGWYDGPALVAWIGQRLAWAEQDAFHGSWGARASTGLQHRYRGYRGCSTTTRRLWAWEHGADRADVYAVDRILIDLGLHLSDVPNDLWRKSEGTNWTKS